MKATHPSPLVRRFLASPRLPDCPLIDMHGHWGPMPGGCLPAAPEPAMMAALARAGVIRIVCSAHDALFGDPDEGNAAMQAAIRRHPDTLAGYWAVNPHYPESLRRAPADFERAAGFIGFKILPDYHGRPVTDPAYAPVFDYADARALPVLVHTWGGSPFNSPAQVDHVAARWPKAVIIMGHAGFGDWERSAAVARERPNVHLDLTAVYAPHDFALLPGGSGTPLPLMSQPQVAGVIEYLVRGAGAEKILLGTDMPWYSPFFALGAILFAEIDDAARRAILYRNAARLLKLDLGETA